MSNEQVAEREPYRLSPADQYWTASRFVTLLFVTLGLAITLIYVISSLYSNDWTWSPFAHDPAHELLPSD